MPSPDLGKVVTFTITHGDRPFLPNLLNSLRLSTGYPFNWHLILSGVSQKQRDVANRAFDEGKVQQITEFPENRGQHHAWIEALAYARKEQARWLLRVDDDITPKSSDILLKMLERTLWLQNAARQKAEENQVLYHDIDRIVSSPRISGLNNPPQAFTYLQNDRQTFPAELVPILGGAFRLHPMALLEDFEPSIYAAIGRHDPDFLAGHIRPQGGLLVRFADLRVRHQTNQLELQDTPELNHARRMGWVWPFLESENV